MSEPTPQLDDPLPRLGLPPGPWVADALCAQTDPEIFFPDKGGSTSDARRVCLDCPVRADCLDYAIANGERFGVWGGYSERERRQIANGTPPDSENQSGAADTEKCGTYAGFSRHLARKTSPCEPCRLACNAYNRDRRRAQKEADTA